MAAHLEPGFLLVIFLQQLSQCVLSCLTSLGMVQTGSPVQGIPLRLKLFASKEAQILELIGWDHV